MSQCLIDKDGQLEGVMPKGGTLPKEKDSTQIVALPPNNDTMFMPKSDFPGGPYGAGTRENPVNLSDTPTEASQTAMCPETKRALWDISHIGAQYVSQVVTVMASWQEVVQTTATHMEKADLRPHHLFRTSGGHAESDKRVCGCSDKSL